MTREERNRSRTLLEPNKMREVYLITSSRWVSRHRKLKDYMVFLGFHKNYYDAMVNISKVDKHVVFSTNHLDLTMSTSSKSKFSSTKSKKPPRLDNTQVCEIITNNNIRTARLHCVEDQLVEQFIIGYPKMTLLACSRSPRRQSG